MKFGSAGIFCGTVLLIAALHYADGRQDPRGPIVVGFLGAMLGLCSFGYAIYAPEHNGK